MKFRKRKYECRSGQRLGSDSQNAKLKVMIAIDVRLQPMQSVGERCGLGGGVALWAWVQ